MADITIDKSDWLFELRDSSGNNPTRLLNAFNRSLTLVLNDAGEASFDINLNDSAAVSASLTAGVNILYIYRNDVLLFTGKVLIVEKVLSEVEQVIRVKAFGWYYLLSNRYVGVDSDLNYSNQDAGAIAWDLINTAQSEINGDLGITEGDIDTSVNLILTYTRQGVKDAIDDLVSQGGIDFEITPSRVFTVFYPSKGIDRSDSIIFKYPGSIKSVRSVSDATTIVNKNYALGRGVGSQEVTVERDDIGSQSVYGLFEKISSYKEVGNLTTLGNMAEYDVLTLKNPRLTYDVQVHGNQSPDLSEYNVGDAVKMQINEDNYTVDQVFRIFQIQISIDENDKEDIRLITALI